MIGRHLLGQKLRHPLVMAALGLVVGWGTVATAAAANRSAHSKEIMLEDDDLRVVLDPHSGALTQLENKRTHWVIERRPELGASFRILAPLPGRRDNFVLGQKQRAIELRKLSGQQIRLRWQDLAGEHGGVLPITLNATVTLTNGALTFDATLENISPLTIETVDYPCFGDFNPPARNSSMQARTMWYGNLQSSDLYPTFRNERGYWGVNFPTKAFGSNRSLFCLIQCPQEGLYVEMHDPTQPYLLEYTFEQHPGLLSSANNRVPRADDVSGVPVRLEFRTCHFLFAHPHSTVRLVPVVLRGYQGDWHVGVDLYKQWRSTWFKPPQLPAWASDVHSWFMLRMNTPEEDYTIPYTNLVAYGEECARVIACDHDITHEDVTEGRHLEDDVLAYGFHDMAPRLQVKNAGSYGIPYRALRVAGMENLLCAARKCGTRELRLLRSAPGPRAS